ncbi:metal-dependent transcriptional regulator [Phaeocystidibacter luteus]|uniref:Transcriptional regulator MntR n=1 Tax=Phaeocystidibacter luteus TaxID=911197 RepID=A0A6N6RFZ5_9FLAO|nr:metal-dependent transcriptional regulator [Phaeocystidibacter luteus]KAB2810091.1 metal-dependent transcriptional regulator [Phaeocystidibacter luteus]
METTYTEENYLKAIWSLSTKSGKGVSTNKIAERLETKASSVTDMIRRLSEKGLVDYIKYQGVKLSDEGREVAVRVIRKHRLWESFLVDKLGFNWDEVHDLAEQLEHIRSTELTDRLDSFLGNPKFDPHGDPIPSRDGSFPERERRLLQSFGPGDEIIVTGVSDSSVAFLQFLNRMKLELGTHLRVVEHIDFDQSMLVQREDGNEQLLPQGVVSQLLVTEKLN